MSHKNASFYLEQLRSCNSIITIMNTFARSIGELSGVDQVALYLLDYTNTKLLLFSEWTKELGSIQGNQQFISLEENRNPLVYALQCGEIYTADISSLLSNNIEHHSFKHIKKGTLIASPLPSPTKSSIGGMLLYSSIEQDFVFSDDNIAIRDYATLLIENILVSNDYKELCHSLKKDLERKETFEKHNRNILSSELLGNSDAIEEIRQKIFRVAPTNIPVLITGETGTGKEVVANLIHKTSYRSKYPIVKINCATLPENLIESELFGHAKGAFTGANKSYQGLIRNANQGTLFLDEIGEMPLPLQAKLLRVLEDGLIRSVGDSNNTKVDVRIIAATNKNLLNDARRGKFRLDLYYRLAGLALYIPPLRERREDITVLAMHFLKIHKQAQKYEGAFFSSDIEKLQKGEYYGNARELSIVIQNMILLAEPIEKIGMKPTHILDGLLSGTFLEQVTNFENILILQALKKFKGNLSKTANSLNIARSTLNSKIIKNAIFFDDVLKKKDDI